MLMTEGSARIEVEDPEATLQSSGGPVDAATAAAGDVVLWDDDDSLYACSAPGLLGRVEVELAA